MKKAFIIAVIALFLMGCSHKWEPVIVYKPTNLVADSVKIAVWDGYILNQGHQYDVVETEAGYDLVLHFVKDGD